MGFHRCAFCRERSKSRYPNTSSGDVNLTFANGHRWVMPDMILHYVADHGWQPPAPFIQDVMSEKLRTGGRRQTRGVTNVFGGATAVGYLEGEMQRGPVPEGFVKELENLMRQASIR